MPSLGCRLRRALSSPGDGCELRALCLELAHASGDDGELGIDALLRLSLWSRLLLGACHADDDSDDSDDSDDDDDGRPFGWRVVGTVAEAAVLEADVRRTRQDCDVFRGEGDGSRALRWLLRRFCARRCLPYRQGLSEVAAPLAAVLVGAAEATAPGRRRSVARRAERLLGALVDRYAWALYGAPRGREAAATRGAVDGFESLAALHVPDVAARLEDSGWSPGAHATPWLLTLGARLAPRDVAVAARLFDVLLATDDASVVFCVGVAALGVARGDVLAARSEGVADALHGLALDNRGAARLGAVLALALVVRAATPSRCLEALRAALATGATAQQSDLAGVKARGPRHEGVSYFQRLQNSSSILCNSNVSREPV